MRDRYGEYYILTGHETPGKCFWCGETVPGYRRYCRGGKHKRLYLTHFHWPEAAEWCFSRAGNGCGDCGGKATVPHHIQPLNGTERLWSVMNRPENLVALCHSCHMLRHQKLRVGVKMVNQDVFEIAQEQGQLVFEGFGGCRS